MIKSRKLLFVLILIGMASAAGGCAEMHEKKPGQQADAGLVDGGGQAGVSGSSGAGGQAGAIPSGGTGGITGSGGAGGFGAIGGAGVGGMAGDAGPASICTLTVTREVGSPDLGVDANPTSICASPATGVQSSRAGRVTLKLDPSSLQAAEGTIEVPSEILHLVVGMPKISVDGDAVDEFTKIVFTDIKSTDDGYSFRAEWPDTIDPTRLRYGARTISIKVEFEMSCSDAGTQNRIVDATTFLSLCFDSGSFVWVSSGDMCTSCQMVCEMAASPIMPSQRPDDLALPQAFYARIVPVAEIGNTLVLFAEHRGARGPVRFRWSASAGRLLDNGESEVVWELPREAGLHQVQVAIYDRDSAAVATLRRRHTA